MELIERIFDLAQAAFDVWKRECCEEAESLRMSLPHLRGVILITTLLLLVINLNSFTLVWLMTGGGPANASQLWITEIYNIAFRTLQYGLASAFSVILFIIMLLLGYFYVKALTANAPRREG